jgi:hypothetical protein
VLNVAGNLPLTLDGAKVYAAPVWLAMGLTLGLSALGVWMARANEPWLGRSPAG